MTANTTFDSLDAARKLIDAGLGETRPRPSPRGYAPPPAPIDPSCWPSSSPKPIFSS